MTAPRQIIPGSVYMVTRRCTQRQFLLRPSALVNQVFLYCLAYAAMGFGVEVVAFVVLSNHYHAIVVDTEGRLPEFMACLNRLVGKCINASLGRFESLWSSEPYSAVQLETEEDIWDKLLYVLANPTAAGLVPTLSQWPGAHSDPRGYGSAPIVVERPGVYFRDDGLMPEKVKLELAVPTAFGDLNPRQFGTRLAKSLEARQAEHVAEFEAKSRSFLGREPVLAQSPYDKPKGPADHMNLNPRVACRDKWRRIEALGRLKEFLEAYREAWVAFKEGVKDVVFPAGTYWMCRHAGCQTAPT